MGDDDDGGFWGDVQTFTGNIVDAGSNLVEGIGQAGEDIVTSVDDTVDVIVDGTWNLVIKQTDDFLKQMFSDLWNGLLRIGDQIIEGLERMLGDPAFWLWLVIVLEVVFLGNGLKAAMGASEGEKAKAFMEASGMTYQGSFFKWASSAHRITYTVSPEYREHFNELWGDFAGDLEQAGIDIAGYARIVGDAMALWNASRAIIGMDPTDIENSWAGKLEEIMSESGDTLQEWGQDPNAMINWFNEHIYLPANSAMAEWSNKVSSTLDAAAKRLDVFAGNLEDFSGAFGDLAESLDEQFGTTYTEDWEEGNKRLEDMILEPWERTKDTLDDLADAFEVRTFELQQEVNQVQIAQITNQARSYNSLGEQTNRIYSFLEGLT